ncbi:anthranilate synthase component 1 [Stella humosa]|uniref:Anthranilate synthase component 1 n=1 Tax=Stella humosa TaxID=94 RepID=A0A3N1MG86_9PROT|nr:anthranilate synthase component I [Stella humosa]ROQ01630.1 anthranilate synthase component 1 [Stella humosa]BBK32011.1 anthranilate synthase component I [Stella humosa]
MDASPRFDPFAETYDSGRPQVVWCDFVADLETPVSAFLKMADSRPMSFLFESVEGGAVRGRYSVIGLKPDLIWRYRDGAAEINRSARFDPDAFEPMGVGGLEALRALVEESKIDLPPSLPPMAAGVFGYLSYDMVRLMERLPDKNPNTLGVPDSIFVRPTVIAIFDNILDRVTLVTPVRPVAEVAARAAYDSARERLADVLADLERSLPHRRERSAEAGEIPEPRSNMTPERFKWMVEQCKEYIRAGDAFQVVPSQRFSVPFRLPPMALYRALRRLNPSPFLFYLDFDGFSIVGSSPEILVRLRDETVTIRPLAGTRRRGASPAEDKALAEELLADPKERAEHLMLLDLGRNDVGRVSRIGTVAVKEQFAIEFYSHVMHISSHVEGQISPDYDALSALVAGFPAGTVSGAPKVRAMEIIEELEQERRGIYAGCVGYFSANGSMDTCIALRTAVVKDGTMYVQAGGGVVADSDPEAEYQETVNKARALFRAAEEAVRFARRG